MQIFELKVDKPSLALEPWALPVRCQRCGRVLTKKESIEAKMGDVCRKKSEDDLAEFEQAQKEG